MRANPSVRRETTPLDQVKGEHLTIDDVSLKLSGHTKTIEVRREIHRRERQESQRKMEARVEPPPPSPSRKNREKPRDRKRREEFFREQLQEAVASAEQGLARLLILAQERRESNEERALAPEAAEALVSTLIRFIDEVRECMLEGPPALPAFSTILSKSLRWPVVLTPFPRDRSVVERELRKGGFGLEAPLNSSSTGKKNAPGTAWAKDFFFIVQRVQRASAEGKLDDMLSGRPGSRELLEDLRALPSLRDEPTVIDAWHRVLIAWLNHHHPDFPQHPDWSKMRGGAARIRERLKDGLRQIAPVA